LLRWRSNARAPRLLNSIKELMSHKAGFFFADGASR
jgi:hypothetical protein